MLNDLTALNRDILFRVLYLYPDRIDDDLIDSFNNKNLIPYFDIPIQHSSDRMLSLMSRSGTRQKYIDVINKNDKNLKLEKNKKILKLLKKLLIPIVDAIKNDEKFDLTWSRNQKIWM